MKRRSESDARDIGAGIRRSVSESYLGEGLVLGRADGHLLEALNLRAGGAGRLCTSGRKWGARQGGQRAVGRDFRALRLPPEVF